MKNLVKRLDENGVVEEDDGPWGALVVIAAKPHQENVTWHKYQWRLCLCYQKLNQVTRAFTSPIPLCGDTVQDIYTEAKYVISVYMDSDYGKVVSEEEVCKILAFFAPDGKRRWKVMTMGYLNAGPTFLEMMIQLKINGTH